MGGPETRLGFLTCFSLSVQRLPAVSSGTNLRSGAGMGPEGGRPEEVGCVGTAKPLAGGAAALSSFPPWVLHSSVSPGLLAGSPARTGVLWEAIMWGVWEVTLGEAGARTLQEMLLSPPPDPPQGSARPRKGSLGAALKTTSPSALSQPPLLLSPVAAATLPRQVSNT